MKRIVCLLTVVLFSLFANPLNPKGSNNEAIVFDNEIKSANNLSESKIAEGIYENSTYKDGKYLVLINRDIIPEATISERLMEEYGIDYCLFENNPNESLDYNEYLLIKRSVIKSLYLPEAEAFIEEVGIAYEDIVDVSSYTGSIIVYLTPERIEEYAKTSYVNKIYPFVDSVQETGEELP